MSHHYLRSKHHQHWAANAAEVAELLGLKGKGSHLPVAGLEPRIIQGVVVWVDPVPEPERKRTWRDKSSTHRTRCQCPDCGQQLSVGRLKQHECKTDRKRYRVVVRTGGATAGYVAATYDVFPLKPVTSMYEYARIFFTMDEAHAVISRFRDAAATLGASLWVEHCGTLDEARAEIQRFDEHTTPLGCTDVECADDRVPLSGEPKEDWRAL